MCSPASSRGIGYEISFAYNNFDNAVMYARLKDSLILVVLLLIGWQVLYLAIGDVALRSPASTVQNLKSLLEDARFLPHVRETGLAFAQGFAIAVVVDC
jgi:ABC-type nitrate/sulfonate/bicarbonate transport system permease component